MEGWVKLHRELAEKPIWLCSTPQQKTVLIAILLMANHEEKEWEWQGEKFVCKAGQFVTSIDKITEKCGAGITQQNVRTALKRFEKFGFLTNQSTKTGRLINVENWGFYQGKGEPPNKASNKDLTKHQQRPNRQLTPNNNDKNYKNERMKEKELTPDRHPSPLGEAASMVGGLEIELDGTIGNPIPKGMSVEEYERRKAEARL